MRKIVNDGDEISVTVSAKSFYHAPRWIVAHYLVKRNQEGHLVLKFQGYIGRQSRSYEKIMKNSEMPFSDLRSLTRLSCTMCHLESVIPNSPVKNAIVIRMRKSNNFKLTKEDKFLMAIVPKYRKENE